LHLPFISKFGYLSSLVDEVGKEYQGDALLHSFDLAIFPNYLS
jgi:hypothetical protein